MRCKRFGCTNLAHAVCGGCHFTTYCGSACADADWTRHLIANHASSAHIAPVTLVLAGSGKQGNLYVGGINALHELDVLGVGAVVSVLSVDADELAVMRNQIGLTRDWQYYECLDERDAPISRYFDESAAWIDARIARGTHVLIHCWAGKSRSVTLALNYMVSKRGWRDAATALEHVRAQRSVAGPNAGFMRQLEEQATTTVAANKEAKPK